MFLAVAQGSVAEWSKALDLGSSLSGGVGSNPTAIKLFYSWPQARSMLTLQNNEFNINRTIGQLVMGHQYSKEHCDM